MNGNPNLPSRITMIMLGVRDLARSTAFYRDTLAFQLQNQAGEFAFLTAGSITLALNAALGRAVPPGPASVEIVVPVESVAASRALLGERGCRFTHEPHEVTAGMWAATLSDPDDHYVTLLGSH
jgi:catechol 2,3-dioxygenase-like lactoylglutathione lyase family enzyme